MPVKKLFRGFFVKVVVGKTAVFSSHCRLYKKATSQIHLTCKILASVMIPSLCIYSFTTSYHFISPIHSLLPSSPLFLGGGCSHQYPWLCYRRSTRRLLEGRAINGIRGRAAEVQQAGECGSLPGFLQSIPHYWLTISSAVSFALNLTELELT